MFIYNISIINKIDKLGNKIIKIENELLNELVKRLLEKVQKKE